MNYGMHLQLRLIIRKEVLMKIDQMKQPIEVFEQELCKCDCGGKPRLRTRKTSSAAGWDLEIYCTECGRSTGGVGDDLTHVKDLWETQIAPSKTDIIKMTMKYLSARDLLISIGMSLSKGTSATRLIHKIEYWLEDDRQEKMTQYEEAVRRLKRLQ